MFIYNNIGEVTILRGRWFQTSRRLKSNIMLMMSTHSFESSFRLTMTWRSFFMMEALIILSTDDRIYISNVSSVSFAHWTVDHSSGLRTIFSNMSTFVLTNVVPTFPQNNYLPLIKIAYVHTHFIQRCSTLRRLNPRLRPLDWSKEQLSVLHVMYQIIATRKRILKSQLTMLKRWTMIDFGSCVYMLVIVWRPCGVAVHVYMCFR